jgi:hypothetical protein
LSNTFRYVLACGGLETARLLLNAQDKRTGLFGGAEGPLGRFYMGHMSGEVARIRFADPKSARYFAYRTIPGGSYRRRIAFSRTALQTHRLPNVIFYPDNPLLGDPKHQSGLLSAMFLVLSTPVIGQRLVAEAIRNAQMFPPRRYLAHVRNVLLDAPGAAVQIADIVWQRFVIGRRKPNLFLYARNGEYPLHYHGEQRPSAESRVTLSESRDGNGMRRLNIDLRFAHEDADGIVRAHQVLDASLQRLGFGKLIPLVPYDHMPAAVLRNSRDGFHQMGVARIGFSQYDGVVDLNCKVFGLVNLYLAGSAVFRTGGQANPTFSAVALGIRLADHLARLCRAEAGMVAAA